MYIVTDAYRCCYDAEDALVGAEARSVALTSGMSTMLVNSSRAPADEQDEVNLDVCVQRTNCYTLYLLSHASMPSH